MMTKKEPGKEPRAAAKDGVLTRRAAIKRIAAGLAGAGMVVVTGVICTARPPYTDSIRYGDAVKLPKGDAAPNK
jgi:hypothetical protein